MQALLICLMALCFRHSLALSSGAPTTACTTLTQQHPGVSASPCTDCPYNVSLVAVDGDPVESTMMYRCGSQHTLRVETSGAQFRGLAVQVRNATGSEAFSNDAAFVGEFVNAPAAGDWRIWNCAAASATHTSNSDKTSVDLTWQAPGDPESSDVTIWYAITQNFVVVHPQLMGATLSSDPAFCAPPEPTTSSPPDPLVLNFINDSPRVSGGTITADIQFSRPVASLQCALTDGPYQDCSNGTVTFENIPPRDVNNRAFHLRVVGVTEDGVKTVIRRSVRVEEEGVCLTHFINDAVTVNGNNATIEFVGLGDFGNFNCDLDRQELRPCSSPQVYSDLSPGMHRLKVVPSFAECGIRRRAAVIRFTV